MMAVPNPQLSRCHPSIVSLKSTGSATTPLSPPTLQQFPSDFSRRTNTSITSKKASSSSLATATDASRTPRPSPKAPVHLLKKASDSSTISFPEVLPISPPPVDVTLDAELSSSVTGQKRGLAIVRKMSRRKKKPYIDANIGSLSTPELHLASDPLLDPDSAEHRRLLAFPPQLRGTEIDGASSSSKLFKVNSLPLDTGLRTPSLALSHQIEYTSLGAVIGAVQQSEANLQAPKPLSRERKSSMPLPMSAANRLSPPSVAPVTRARALTNESLASSLTASLTEDVASQAAPLVFKRKSATDWLRSKRWTAALVGKSTGLTERRASGDSSSHSSKGMQVSTARQLPAKTSPEDSVSSLTNLGDTAVISSRDGSQDVDLPSGGTTIEAGAGSSQLLVPSKVSIKNEAALLRLRAARTYLTDELRKLSAEESKQDEQRINALAQSHSAFGSDGAASDLSGSEEMLAFWTSIQSGVLLCLLANHLKPGAIDRIDRRQVEWVKADNLSRFLRAARDFFNVRSKDLFHPLDLADATVEGLNRAVHTILVIQSSAKTMGLSIRSPSSPLTSSVKDRIQSKRKSLVTPAQSPGYFPLELPTVDGYLSVNSGSSHEPGSGNNAIGDLHSNVEEHRRAAEAKLTQRTSTSSESTRSRESWRLSTRRHPPILVPSSSASSTSINPRSPKGPAISFAEGSFTPRSSSDEEARSGTPYKDRRMSESTLSLSGVAEEESEDTNQNMMMQIAAQGKERMVELPPHSQAISMRTRSPPQSARFSGEFITAPVPIPRSSSQRRISREIALAQHGSIDGWEDQPSDLDKDGPPSSTPSRSLTGTPGIPLASQLRFLQDSGGNSHVVRVPFPRSSSSTTESSFINATSTASSRSNRFSTTGTSTTIHTLALGGSDSSKGPHNGVPLVAVTPPLRPIYRHLRYNSELHLTVRQRSLSRSDDGSPSSSTSGHQTPARRNPRLRSDTEVGPSFPSPSVATLVEDGRPELRRADSIAPGSRHKLVLTEEGGQSTTTFQMGNCIGRGQFGSVYRALNLNTGQMVAVKRIKVEGRSEEEVTQLMKEVDLLKSLAHPSVVKYEGLVRGTDVISIILEYVENGSLLHTLKAFGNFPEQLVASYVVKILEGLVYLHEVKVVHCDLKAANILTTKNGNVKLSDFGVSLNLQAMEKVQNNDALGTPNWMAPEVIELQGASTAADIWSLGCTIIELLTGKPPYGDMLAMSAMFRIVEDERPPLPGNCSDDLKDFLIQCFQKDPTQRPRAEDLFKHSWLLQTWSGYKEIRPQDSLPFLKRLSSDAAVAHRLDVRTLQVAVKEADEELSRVSSRQRFASPRPSYRDSRSSSVPAGESWISAKANTAATLETHTLRNVDMNSTRSQDSYDKVPTAFTTELSDGKTKGSQELPPSQLEVDHESPLKLHRFVKSTFSRNVRCHLCRQSVRKHAVFCEECGLMCHARCARDITSTCDIRAQLMLFHRQQQESLAGRGTTNGLDTSISSGTTQLDDPPPSSSPGLLAVGLKYAIAKSRRLSRGQANDVGESASGNFATQMVGIEGDSPTISSSEHNRQTNLGDFASTSIDATLGGQSQSPGSTEKTPHGKRRHHRSLLGSSPKPSPVLPVPSVVGPYRESASVKTTRSEAELQGAIREGLPHYSSYDDSGRKEIVQSSVGSAASEVLTSKGPFSPPSASNSVPERQRSPPISTRRQSHNGVARQRPTHRPSHSTGNLINLTGLAVDIKKMSIPTPSPSPAPEVPAEVNRRSHAVSDPDGSKGGQVRSSLSPQQQSPPPLSTSSIGEKWRSRRASLSGKRREDCLIM